MTPDDPASATLAECRAALETATPLPWELHVTAPGTPHEMTDIWRGDDEEYVAQDVIPADGCFIVTARKVMPLLLAAIEAVLEPHQPGRIVIFGSLCKRHENHRHFSITSTEADGVRACPDCTATVYSSCAYCGPQVSVDACPVRAGHHDRFGRDRERRRR